MKKQWFSTEQIVAVWKKEELGLPVADLIRQIEISPCACDAQAQRLAGRAQRCLSPVLGRRPSLAHEAA